MVVLRREVRDLLTFLGSQVREGHEQGRARKAQLDKGFVSFHWGFRLESESVMPTMATGVIVGYTLERGALGHTRIHARMGD